MSLSIDLAGQVVALTGGTAGIGRGIVEAMLTAGARVAFCAPDEAECRLAEAELAGRFGPDRALGIAADLRDRASLSAFVAAVVSRWEKIDTLVCNAASFGRHSAIADVDCDGFAAVFEANVVNNFYLCREVAPAMEARGGGSIILVTSIAGFSAMPTNVAYSSSKAALTSLGRSLAAEYAGRGIRVNCLSPGLIRSEASRDIWQDEEFARSYTAAKIPMQRIGEPNEIGTVCTFLASSLASYMTGATIPVDGGRLGIGLSAGSSAQAEKARS